MRKLRAVLVAINLVLLIALVGVAAANATDNRPEAPPPLLAPPDSTGYEQHPGNVPIAAQDGRLIAQFHQAPDGFNETVQVYLPAVEPWVDPQAVAYRILASVLYSGSGHTILVSTAQPSPEALRHNIQPGERAVSLPGGRDAWMSVNMGGDFPNRVLFTQGELIITVASDLLPEQLQDLAAQVGTR